MELGKRALEAMEISRDFWHKRKVFITGHTGFKGSWLSLWLERLGADVIGYSLPTPTNPSLFEAARVSAGMKSVMGDVRDLGRLQESMEKNRPEIILHLAAQSLVRPSYADPVETYSTNVMGTVNVLEAARGTSSVRVIVVVTSDKCYENKEWVWGYREADPLGGFDPYSSSKGCAELVTGAYRSSYFPRGGSGGSGISIASVRAGNVIGGGDWARERLIPDVMRAFLAQQAVLIRNPNAVRPWQHVLEPLSGYLCLAEKLWESGTAYLGAWNFGPAEEDTKPVSWIVERLANLWGEDARWEIERSDTKPHEAVTLRLDSSKAVNYLGWRTKLSISQALEWVVEWYRSSGANGDMREVTESEISRFENIAHERM